VTGLKAIVKEGLIVLVPETEGDREELLRWFGQHDDHVFRPRRQESGGVFLQDLGPHAEACRLPIRVHSGSSEPGVSLISNFALAPFEFEGREYASVEGFWQGLKFPDRKNRRRVAGLHGLEAKRAGAGAPPLDTIMFEGQEYRVGTWEHWTLMRGACLAKFSQHEGARQALLGTRDRPLFHRSRRDSKTIPGAIMAQIWMKIRAQLVKETDSSPLIPRRPAGR